MIKLRPWKGSKHEFEVDVIVNGAQGRTLRRRVKAPVTGKSNAERWAKALEQELLAQLLAPEPEPEQAPAKTYEEFARDFLDLCKADRLGINTRMNYDVHLRHYLLPVLARRRLDEIKPSDIKAIKTSLTGKSHNTMCEVLKTLRRIFNRAIAEKEISRVPVEFEIPRRNHKLPCRGSSVLMDMWLRARRRLCNPSYSSISREPNSLTSATLAHVITVRELARQADQQPARQAQLPVVRNSG